MGFLQRKSRNKSLETPETYGFEAVDHVRNRLFKTDYERFSEDRLEDVIRAQKSAVWSSTMGGREQLNEEIAFDKMVIDMRVPIGPVHREARQWWLDIVMTPDSEVYQQLKALGAAGKLPPLREFYGS